MKPYPILRWPTSTGPRRAILIFAAVFLSLVTAFTPVRAQVSTEMVLESDQLVFDYDSNVISAIGNVLMEYLSLIVTADRVTYYQATGRLVAVGNVRIDDGSGSIFTAASADVTDDFREGFVEQLYVVTADRTFFTAESAQRYGGDVTEFYNATYTACEVMPPHDRMPPAWRVRASKIILNEEEEMIYFEQARFEVAGVPIAYLPRLSTPDPSVTRKTGFLRPDFSVSSSLGFGVSVPFFWAPAPNYDLTATANYFVKAGLLAEAEWRHRMRSGMYTLSAAGISQKPMGGDPRMFRGAVRTTGEFNLNRFWTFGWDGTLQTDRGFTNFYGTVNKSSPFVTSQAYLTGINDQTFFDAHAYYFQNTRLGASPRNDQDRQAIVYPIVDFERVLARPILGGEVRFSSTLIHLSRGANDPFTVGVDTYYYGLAGTYTRLSKELSWERRMIGPLGQVFTPFVFGRADLYLLDLDAPPAGVTGDPFSARLTGGAGFEWSWPFLIQSQRSRHILEPVLQVVARPSEAMIGALPNEDAQSVIFDTTSLLALNRFSGDDRIEGGTRVTAALRYWGQFGDATFEAMVGQSFHLAGINSYATPGVNNTAMGTGLDGVASHIVAAFSLDSGHGHALSASARFDPASFELQRAIVTGEVVFGRFEASAGLAYERSILDLGGAPETAFHITGRAAVDITDKWRVSGTVDYDVVVGAVVADSITLSYTCDCVAFDVTYSEKRAPGVVLDRSIMFGLSLRTLGDFDLGR